MQYGHPLTPTLSPAAGEREKRHAQRSNSLSSDYSQSGLNGFPLPIRWGEGQGEGARRLNSNG